MNFRKLTKDSVLRSHKPTSLYHAMQPNLQESISQQHKCCPQHKKSRNAPNRKLPRQSRHRYLVTLLSNEDETVDNIRRERCKPMRTSTWYWYLAPPLFLQCFPILYCETPMFKPRFMPVLLAATHHMKSASPKLCCWSISEHKNLNWKEIWFDVSSL